MRSFGGKNAVPKEGPISAMLFAKHTHPSRPLTDKEAKCICLLVASRINISGASILHLVGRKNGGAPSSEFGMGGGCGYKLSTIWLSCMRGLRAKHIKLTGKKASKLASTMVGRIEGMKMEERYFLETLRCYETL